MLLVLGSETSRVACKDVIDTLNINACVMSIPLGNVTSWVVVTGRLVSKTGLTTVFPVVGLALVTINLVILALWASAFGTAAFAGLLLCNGMFMGTVMGVVQVSVQSAAGPLQLGEAAASVQFSRSIGAAFGTALVATVLFAALSIRDPEVARIFATMVEHGRHVGAALPTVQQAEILAKIKIGRA